MERAVYGGLEAHRKPSWVGAELHGNSVAKRMECCYKPLSWAGTELHEYAAASVVSLKTHKENEDAACIALVRTCTKNKDLRRGIHLHEHILRRGLLESCSDSLVTMYAKCGDLRNAKALLDMHKSRDVITWTSLISGYTRIGQGQNALDCFECMQNEGIPPNAYTYSCVLKACALTGLIDKGKETHDQIVRQGLLQHNIVLGTALVDMYAKCGDLLKAQNVHEMLFSRDVASWNALIAGFAQAGQGEQALNCFERMQCEGVPPNPLTLTGILIACGSISALDKGKEIHEEIVRQGWLQNNIVLGNALVDMYAKCGALSLAQDVLEKLPFRNVVTWSALLAGYAQEGQGEQSLKCFKHMQHEGILPNAVTYTSVLKACATIGAIDKGKQIHEEIMKQGLLKNNVMLGTALVDMYAKCGALSKAHHVLKELPSRNVVLWSALITGYAQKGQGEDVLHCFECMQREGILPNAVTFLCALNACNHLGLVNEGHSLFMNMSLNFSLKPSIECYACMVDLLGRAGHIERAVQLIQEMPSSNYSAIWLALLGACQKWGDVNVGRWAFEQAVLVDKNDGPAYKLMENIYAAAGMQEDALIIEALRVQNKVWKRPECTWWVDSNKHVHAFNVEDTKHAQRKLISTN